MEVGKKKKKKKKNQPVTPKKPTLFQNLTLPSRLNHPKPRRPKRTLIQCFLRLCEQLILPFLVIGRGHDFRNLVSRKASFWRLQQFGKDIGPGDVVVLVPEPLPVEVECFFEFGARVGCFYVCDCALRLWVLE
jgi:hypothetical protein